MSQAPAINQKMDLDLRAWIIVTSKDVIRLTSNGLTLQTSVYKKCSRERNASGVSDLTTVKLSKTFVSEVKGSMNIFSAMGPTAATWKVVEGQQAAVFGTDEMAITDTPSLMHDISNSAATNALKNVTITRATILQTYSTFPVPLGVTINVLPKNESCDTGERYTFTALPCCTVNTPAVIFDAGETQGSANEWRKLYPTYNKSNLETLNVLKVPNTQFVFVHQEHPVVGLLRCNKNQTGVDIDNTPKMDGQWYKITEQVMRSCCDVVRTQVLGSISTSDLTDLSVQLQRLGNTDWSDMKPADVSHSFHPSPDWDEKTHEMQMSKHMQIATDKECYFLARIQLEYEIEK